MNNENEVDQDLNTGEDNTSENGLNAETLLVQKTKMREQRDLARQEAEQLKQRLAQLEGQVANKDQQTTNVTAKVEAELEQVKFAIAHRDLDADEIAEVFIAAKARGISADEAFKLPIVSTFIEARKAEKNKDADVPMTNRSAKFTPPKPTHEMTPEEHKAYWAKSVRG